MTSRHQEFRQALQAADGVLGEGRQSAAEVRRSAELEALAAKHEAERYAEEAREQADALRAQAEAELEAARKRATLILHDAERVAAIRSATAEALRKTLARPEPMAVAAPEPAAPEPAHPTDELNVTDELDEPDVVIDVRDGASTVLFADVRPDPLTPAPTEPTVSSAPVSSETSAPDRRPIEPPSVPSTQPEERVDRGDPPPDSDAGPTNAGPADIESGSEPCDELTDIESGRESSDELALLAPAPDPWLRRGAYSLDRMASDARPHVEANDSIETIIDSAIARAVRRSFRL